jgi:hypothetical protein
MRIAWALLLLALIFLSCAPQQNTFRATPTPDGSVAGFWRGLWHGLILPVSFVISLFSESIGVYETHNNGGWYNFGFVLGALLIFEGPAATRRGAHDDKEST